MENKNIHKAKELNESEREELIRLRAENEYIKAENEIIKKKSPWEKSVALFSQGEKAAIVKELKEKGYGLKYLLIAIDLPKSTYYFEINKVDKIKVKNIQITDKITEIFNLHKYQEKGIVMIIPLWKHSFKD